jgi:hypothetical protein
MAWRSAFPGETPDKPDGLAGRDLVAQPDRTDVVPPFSVPMPGPKAEDFAMNPPVANAVEDKVPGQFSRYFNQQYHREAARDFEARLEDEMRRADTNNDGGIEHKEFKKELEERQHRNVEDVKTLFDKYTMGGTSPVMSKENFKALAATGYAPLGMKPLPLQAVASETGYWGSQFKCPEAHPVAIGARMKVLPYALGQDNTMVNGLELECGTIDGASAPDQEGDTMQSAEGTDGRWMDVKKCPEGMAIDSMRARLLPYLSTQDNTGLTNVSFTCRSKTLTEVDKTSVTFAIAEPSDVKPSPLGGWNPPQICPIGSFMCSLQTRVDTFASDKMGITMLTSGCCGGFSDCSSVCSSKDSLECKSCQDAKKA